MSTQPLFTPTREELKKALRLSGVKESHDAEAIISQALLVVRGNFYRRLGLPRVAYLLTLTRTDNPTTTEEILRSIADTTEVKWVRLELLDSMPTMFMDGSNNTLQEWDEEAPFRTTSTFQIASMKKSLHEAIEQSLDMLAGREEQGDETTVRSWTGTPLDSPPKPFDSIRNIKSFY